MTQAHAATDFAVLGRLKAKALCIVPSGHASGTPGQQAELAREMLKLS
jgi:hypothetical protein